MLICVCASICVTVRTALGSLLPFQLVETGSLTCAACSRLASPGLLVIDTHLCLLVPVGILRYNSTDVGHHIQLSHEFSEPT